MNTRIYAALAAALTCAAASAQSLSTEVVVDRTVLPAERAASRPAGVTPALVLPQTQVIDLSTADYTALSPLTRAYSPLSPVAAPGLTPLSPYRGYAVIGYGPLYNLGLSAGYRAISTDRTTLSIHGQFDGESYKGVDTDEKYKYNGGRIGADLNTAVGASSRVLAAASVGYAGFTTPFIDRNQSYFTGDLGVKWLSAVGRLSYKVGASAEFESHNGSMPVLDSFGQTYEYNPRQQVYGFEAGAAYKLSETGSAGLDIEGEFMSTTDMPTLGSIGITPYYTLRYGAVTARIGLTVDKATGDSGKTHIYPDVHIAVAPAGTPVAVYVNVTGCTYLNTLAAMRQLSPYLRTENAFGRSEVPVAVDGGITVGPFSGFTVKIFGGYAKADDWLMMNTASFGEENIKGWHAGIEAGYSFGRLARLTAGVQAAPSSEGHAWYLWRDRAARVISAALDLHPVDRLDVTVGYAFRSGRRAFCYLADTYTESQLGCVSDLSASATYGVNDAVSVFLRGENLLGRRYDVIPGVSSQGAMGMAGVSVKF